jgi:hypothetical protein
MNTENHYKRVVETLKLLAAPYDQQQKYLPEFVYVPSDITTSFEDVFLLLPSLIEENAFSNISIASLLRTYIKMQWCLANLNLDDFSDGEWNKVRELSKETLLQLGESLGDPDLKYV